MGYRLGPRLREIRLLDPPGRRRWFTQTRAHLTAQLCGVFKKPRNVEFAQLYVNLLITNSRCTEEGPSFSYPRLEGALVGPLLKPANKRGQYATVDTRL